MTDLLGPVVLSAGALLLVVAAWGVIVLPDALSRQHAATKAGTLALALVCLGAMLIVRDAAWTWRLLLILGFLLATLPVSSHLLARAAVAEAGLDRAVQSTPLTEPSDHPPGGVPATTLPRGGSP
jgi:multicomponent Na+:H+ antiporter subunit G